MAIETDIIIELGPWGVRIPEFVHVSRGTLVRFLLRNHSDFRVPPLFRNLRRIELYFENKTPSGFYQRYNKQVPNLEPYGNVDNPERDIIIAEGKVESTGDYKYGIKATTSNDEELFDEDPFLIVH